MRAGLSFDALIRKLLKRRTVMNQSVHQEPELSIFGDPIARMERALSDLRNGKGVLVVDDEDRENQGDLIFSA